MQKTPSLVLLHSPGFISVFVVNFSKFYSFVVKSLLGTAVSFVIVLIFPCAPPSGLRSSDQSFLVVSPAQWKLTGDRDSVCGTSCFATSDVSHPVNPSKPKLKARLFSLALIPT